MFRIIFRNLAIQKNICNDPLKIRYFATAAPTKESDEKNGLFVFFFHLCRFLFGIVEFNQIHTFCFSIWIY